MTYSSKNMLSTTALAALYRWLYEKTGLYITDANEDQVLQALKELANKTGSSIEDYAFSLLNGQLNAQLFIDAVTTHESFFLRHKSAMQAIIVNVIKPLIRKGIRPRILSAPCAQGEEPFSFLMLLQDAGINPLQVEIIAVDIAEQSIQKARQASYNQYALRQIPKDFLMRHFIRKGSDFFVHPGVRQSVQFERMNLFTQNSMLFEAGFDVIFCHNLFIYFDKKGIFKLLNIFKSLLHDGGYFLVDMSETAHIREVFKRINLDKQVIAYTHKKSPDEAHEAYSLTTHALKTGFQPFSAAPASTMTHSTEDELSADEPSTGGVKSSQTRIKKSRHNKKKSIKILIKAEQAYAAKDFARALDLFDKIIKTKILYVPVARLGKARILLDNGEEIEALDEAEKSLQANQLAGVNKLSSEQEADAHAIILLALRSKNMHGQMKEHLVQLRRLNAKHKILSLFKHLK